MGGVGTLDLLRRVLDMLVAASIADIGFLYNSRPRPESPILSTKP